MASNFEKFQKLLEELFQLDRADLDFGIYRIMNQKRDEIVRFLEKDLLPQVKEAFSQYKSADKAELQKQLDKLIEQITGAGMNPADSPKVQELRQKMADSSVDVTALENEVFSHLYNFFRRYYSEGDFISQRRYKEGVYAIPYEGEEVKLHWANHDQYYVKSSEYFRDYIFTMPSGKRVRVHLVAASTEQDNKKEAPGKERRFVLCVEDPIYEENGELFIRFEYRPDDGKKTQDALNKEAIERIVSTKGFDEWRRELSKPAPTGKNPNRTVLEKHLTQYTAKNTFDYFIHKDLGGFLRRELDFYIKNEVMHLDDVENETVPRVEQYLSKIKVIRRIAHKVIQFLEQLENFQKKLWLKKKFVVETNYCITLDRVPEELYPEIAANDAQRKEWVRLFAINEIEENLHSPSYSIPLSVKFLNANPHLIIDTAFFKKDFIDRLLACIEDLEAKISGLLIHSENFQALMLLETRYQGGVKCIYIDPPYNTGNDEFPYKDNYQASSWFTMMLSRCLLAKNLLHEDGLFFLQIGDEEVARSRLLLEMIFPERKNSVVVRRGVKNVQAQFSDIDRLNLGHDTVHVAAKRSKVRIPHLRHSLEESKPGKWDTFWRGTDRPTMRYDLFGQNPDTGQWRWEEGRAMRAKANYEFFLAQGSSLKNMDEWYVENLQAGEDLDFVRQNDEGVIQYYVPPQGSRLVSDNWLDIPAAGNLTEFPHEKSVNLLMRIIDWNTSSEDVVLDFFAGSGSTAHATFFRRPANESARRYIQIEMGAYFDIWLKPRLQRFVYSDTWKDGKPLSRRGTSHTFKYLRLESYEDALNNLELKRTPPQEQALFKDADVREQYLLSYMLDVESRGSQSLLNFDSFRSPDQYKLKVERNGETQLVNVDLIETFNWLLGLTVKHLDVIAISRDRYRKVKGVKYEGDTPPSVRVIKGTNPGGESVLVLWRDLDKMDNDLLDEWFTAQDYNVREQVFDLIYVNGDNNLENLRRTDQTWKVRLIEEEFQRLMFDVQDV